MLVTEGYDSDLDSSGTVGANLAEGKPWQRSSRPRKIVRMGLIGGVAQLDAQVDVYYGTTKVATLTNFFLVASGYNTDYMNWHTSNLVCPAGVPINVFVSNGFHSTITFLFMDIKEL